MTRLFAVVITIAFFYGALAQVTNISGPAGSGKFGSTITVLPNGNYVVTDPFYDDGALLDVGAVYLFNGNTHSVISILKGSSANDNIGNYGVTVLDNGNFLIRSPNWDNGSVNDAGAITWCNGMQGLSGIINITNSLVGSSLQERLGVQEITRLTNGNYVIRDPNWMNGDQLFAGAVIWCNASAPPVGIVSASNALIGSKMFDRVGNDVIPLSNGNYVVSMPTWNNGPVLSVGAVTWCNGTTGRTGTVSSSNSLVGTHMNDQVGLQGIVKLSNGNYVVISPNWNSTAGLPSELGAVTWGSGTTGIAGEVSSTNSLTRTGPTLVGGPFVTPLANGNYVVTSPGFGKSGLNCLGAVTWADGSTGISGAINSFNSILGSNSNYPAQITVVPLNNGNYVIAYPTWNYGAGAVTWVNGTTGITGVINSNNSLLGNHAGDNVGFVTTLVNGNYVVSSPTWSSNLVSRAGAITWCSGTYGRIGFVNETNSLIGSHYYDQIGSDGITPLQNNKYVIRSPRWDNGSVEDAGAATLCSGDTVVTGSISAANSLIGSTTNDHIGKAGVIPLLNGNYLVASPEWDNGSVPDAGAVTWVSGSGSGGGTVGINNSLVGTHSNDHVGHIIPLNNGNYVVMAQEWNSSAGAVTWGSGMSGTTGAISASNSVVGSQPNDRVGFDNTIVQLSNGNYLVRSPYWSNGSLSNAGAITWCSGTSVTAGIVDSSNSLVGTHSNDGSGYGIGYTISTFANGNYAVRNMNWDNSLILDAGAVTWGNGSVRLSGSITDCNSVKGGVTVSSDQDFMPFCFNDVYGVLIVGRPIENKVSIYNPRGIIMPSEKDSSVTFIHGNAAVPLQSVTGCRILATLTPNGSHPVDGKVMAKTWTDSTIIFNNVFYAGRHYEIMPATDAATSTANITLYFTQADFDAFNAKVNNTQLLPVNQNDNASISRLRIYWFAGTSSDQTGLPGTYPGNPVVIDPQDGSITWNSQQQRWETSFDNTGFGGFFVGTYGSLPVDVVPVTADNSKDAFLLFPNPVDEKINLLINLQKPEHIIARIVDNTGRVVKQYDWNIGAGTTSYVIDVISLARGTYHFSIQGKKTYKTLLFFKN